MSFDLREILDVSKIQLITDSFYEAAGIPSSIITIDGEVLTGSGWQDACACFHRKHPETLKACLQSDTLIREGLLNGKKRVIYKCPNGLIDAAAPIFVGGEHVANFFTGQFLFHKPDKEEMLFFEEQATKYGFNKEAYLNAILALPVIEEKRIQTILDYLTKFAQFIAEFGYTNLENKRYVQEIINSRDDLENRILERTESLLKSNYYLQKEIERREKAESILSDAMVELQRSNTELEQFAYIASHDLQEPLRAIAGFLQLIQDRYKNCLDEKGNHYIDRSVKAAHRMQTLINDILTLSRVNTKGEQFVITDIGLLLKRTLDELEPTIKKANAKVSYTKLPNVLADANQIQSLLQNLIQNAIKYAGEQTPIIEIGCEELQNSYQFYVKDNGIGIESKFHERIFMVFQRLHTNKEYPGTGLGLALCRKIIERHGGKIWIESEFGKGSTFYFSLPQKVDAKN